MKKILVVEDDSVLNKTLAYNLINEGYNVSSALSFSSAVIYLEDRTYDLIILDINLPDGNGFTLCEDIKEKYSTAVIFLTANDMENDMIKGFDLGAVDYITKPFHISVLLKKIKIIIDRADSISHMDIFNDGTLYVNFSASTVSLENTPVTLSPTEYKTLKVFVQNPKIVLTRQRLLEILWDIDSNFVDEHTLTSAISRLRNKIGQSGKQYIKTVYGMGYMWIGGVTNE
jgi:Response regulators consisting of a CheY-like receiver domain and a winged-helix DNA-binding domain